MMGIIDDVEHDMENHLTHVYRDGITEGAKIFRDETKLLLQSLAGAQHVRSPFLFFPLHELVYPAHQQAVTCKHINVHMCFTGTILWSVASSENEHIRETSESDIVHKATLKRSLCKWSKGNVPVVWSLLFLSVLFSI